MAGVLLLLVHVMSLRQHLFYDLLSLVLLDSFGWPVNSLYNTNTDTTPLLSVPLTSQSVAFSTCVENIFRDQCDGTCYVYATAVDKGWATLTVSTAPHQRRPAAGK